MRAVRVPCSHHARALSHVHAGGRVAFLGPTEAALDHFCSLGYRCPPLTNPAEFLIDLVSGE